MNGTHTRTRTYGTHSQKQQALIECETVTAARLSPCYIFYIKNCFSSTLSNNNSRDNSNKKNNNTFQLTDDARDENSYEMKEEEKGNGCHTVIKQVPEVNFK